MAGDSDLGVVEEAEDPGEAKQCPEDEDDAAEGLRVRVGACVRVPRGEGCGNSDGIYKPLNKGEEENPRW